LIGRLKGIVMTKRPPELLLDVNGVGYEVLAPMTTFYVLPEEGQPIVLLTHLVVREDAHQLFGFHNESSRYLFRTLIKVSGIGPKLALAILSGMETDQLVHYIQSGNSAALTHIPGIGKKTAERLIIETRDRLKEWAMTCSVRGPVNNKMEDAISALMALGYKPHDAKRVVMKIGKETNTTEELIRLALQEIR